MKIYFVRHGETDWNKERKIQGQTDIPLNAFGRRLAEETREGLADVSFDVCFTSPLVRAKETAQIILGFRTVPVIEDRRLEEMAFGEFEGRCCSKEGWDVPDSFRSFFDAPADFVPAKGGEDFSDVKKRTGEFLTWLYGREEYKDGCILIATHGAALAGLLNNIKKQPLSAFWGVGVHKNCAVTIVDVTEGKAHIVAENQTYYKEDVKPW